MRMSGSGTPSATLLMISVSARTAQTLEIIRGCSAARAFGPISSTGIWRYFEHRSTKRPAPTARFSFILNLRTFPVSETDIVREACVPTSTTRWVLREEEDRTARRRGEVAHLEVALGDRIAAEPGRAQVVDVVGSDVRGLTERVEHEAGGPTGFPREGPEAVARTLRPSSRRAPLMLPAPRSRPPVIMRRPPASRSRPWSAAPIAPRYWERGLTLTGAPAGVGGREPSPRSGRRHR